MERITHLGRSFSLAYPSHRWVAGMMAVAAGLGWAYPSGRTPAPAMVQSALTVLLVWALIRELSPDHRDYALWGAALAGASSIYTGATALAALAGLTVASRIVVRTTGLPPKLTDIVAVGVFMGVFARTPLAWAAGLSVAAAVAVDTNLPRPAVSWNVWLAGAVGVAVTITAVASEALESDWSLPGWFTLALGAVVLSATFGIAVAPPASLDDRGGTIEVERLRAARNLVAFALILGTMAGGALEAEATWPGWIALMVASLPPLRQ